MGKMKGIVDISGDFGKEEREKWINVFFENFLRESKKMAENSHFLLAKTFLFTCFFL